MLKKLHHNENHKSSNRSYYRLLTLLYLLSLVSCCWFIYQQTSQSTPLSYDDDLYVYENAHVQNGVDLKYALTSNDSNLWHPTTWLSHQIDWILFPNNPAAHHRINVLLHFLNSSLITLLLYLLYRKSITPWIVGMLFAVHPIAVEVVAWEAQRKELLALFFILLTTLSYIHHSRHEKRPTFYLILSLCFYALACGSKPNAIAFVPLCFIFIIARKQWRSTSANIYLACVSVIALITLWINFQFTQASELQEVSTILPLTDRLNLIPSHAAYYFQSLLCLSDRHLLHVPQQPGHGLITVTFILAICGLAYYLFRSGKTVLLLGLAITICFWLPSSGILPVSIYYVSDRYFYISQIGVLLIIAHLANLLFQSIKNHSNSSAKIIPWLSALAFTGIVILLTIRSHREASFWRSSLTLFEREIKHMPNDLTARMHYSKALFSDGKFELALSHSIKATQLDPQSFDAQFNLAKNYLQLNQQQLAIKHLALALQSSRKHHPSAYQMLAHQYMQKRQFSEAIQTLKQGYQYFPNNNDICISYAASLYTARQDLTLSKQLVQQVLQRDPSHTKALKLDQLLNR